MKPIGKSLFVFLILSLPFFLLQAQQVDSVLNRIPNVAVKTLDNTTFHTSEINNDGKPIVLIFWKSCCPPNIEMLDAIDENYEDWKEETGVLIFTVSIDDSRTSYSVGTLVNGKGWTFIALLDVNSDFKRAMNVNGTPHIFVINGNQEVVWQKTTYTIGDEEEIFKALKTL